MKAIGWRIVTNCRIILSAPSPVACAANAKSGPSATISTSIGFAPPPHDGFVLLAQTDATDAHVLLRMHRTQAPTPCNPPGGKMLYGGALLRGGPSVPRRSVRRRAKLESPILIQLIQKRAKPSMMCV